MRPFGGLVGKGSHRQKPIGTKFYYHTYCPIVMHLCPEEKLVVGSGLPTLKHNLPKEWYLLKLGNDFFNGFLSGPEAGQSLQSHRGQELVQGMNKTGGHNVKAGIDRLNVNPKGKRRRIPDRTQSIVVRESHMPLR